MSKKFKIATLFLLGLGMIALGIVYLNTHNFPVLMPKGIIALKERRLIIITLILMLIVLIPVYVIAMVFATKYRDGHKGKYTPEWDHNAVYESIWWGIPLLIISFLAVLTWITSHTLNPFRPIESDAKPVIIQAVSLEWKWLFIYPEEGIATVNEIYIPVNRPINFEITSDAPMNSLWIAQLGGQIYAMAGMRSQLHLMANEIGVYRGCSSNFSGTGFAGMHFKTHATSEEDYEKWISRAKSSGNSMELQAYNQLLVPTQNNKPVLYNLKQDDLFDKIIEKYMAPNQE